MKLNWIAFSGQESHVQELDLPKFLIVRSRRLKNPSKRENGYVYGFTVNGGWIHSDIKLPTEKESLKKIDELVINYLREETNSNHEFLALLEIAKKQK